MRVFVTGATGFIGSVLVKQLLAAGYTVVGLARSDAGAAKLTQLGAEPLRGDLEDLDSLRRGASDCDAVLHLGFIHDFARFADCCAKDQAAIAAMGEVLAEAVAAGKPRALVVTSGALMLRQGVVGYEGDSADESNPHAAARFVSEGVCTGFAKRGVRASVVRLAPTVHGYGLSGFMGVLASAAVKSGVVRYIGDGQNRWSAVNVDDAVKLYMLAMEQAVPGSTFHGVAEEGVYVKDLATKIGQELGVPVESITLEQAQEHYGPLVFGVKANNIVSSAKTQKDLGWTPSGVGALEGVKPTLEYLKAQAATSA